MDIFKFNKEDNTFIFTGDKLEVFVPERYQQRGWLTMADRVSVLGIFDMKVNDTVETGFLLPAMITMEPIDISEVTIDGNKFFVMTLNKGCVFHNSNVVVQSNGAGYFMWNEFLALGHLPKFLTYDKIITLFDDLQRISGAKLKASHPILELIYAHMFRNPDQMTQFYRHTKMNFEPRVINLHDVAYGATTTHSRIFGSYAGIGLNSALLNQEDKNNELEDIFRQ